jgi:hypothetical protein
MNFRKRGRCWSVAIVATCWAHTAAAYRPFDGTDADVADPGEVELEIGPAGYHREGTSRFVVAPALVANYGFLPDFEAVLEGRQDILLRGPRYSSELQDVALSVKSLLRRGSLQGERGISVALEVGMLLPGSERRLGTHVGSIFSLQLPAIALHLNLANNILYSLHYEAAASLIIEGPGRWRIRPVAELLVEREFGSSRFPDGLAESLLVGGIGQLTDSVSVDLGARYGRADGQHEEEIRAGLTWAFKVWRE